VPKTDDMNIIELNGFLETKWMKMVIL